MIDQYRSKLNRALAEFNLAKRQLEEEKDTLRRAKQQESSTIEAQKLLQGIAETIQQQAHQQIADIVSRCLEAVFGDDAYAFRIDFRQARGKTEARLLFVRNGHEFDPIDASGGGVVDVASFALRLACLCLSTPANRRVLVLDEPFRFVSRDYQPLIREMLESLAEEMELQIILVTHSDLLKIGKVVEL